VFLGKPMNFLEQVDKHIATSHTYRPKGLFVCGKCDNVEVQQGGIWFSTKGHRVFIPDCYKPQEIAQ